MSQWAINIEQLIYHHQDQPCLDIPQWQVARGESVQITGLNGSGKTTLLKILAGLILPDSGMVSVLDQNYSGMSDTERDRFRADHIGYIFQKLSLLPFLPAIDNILLPVKFSRRRSNQLNSLSTTPAYEAYQLMAKLQLEDPSRLRLKVDQLSIGLQQRVAIARALIGSPDLILADEPASPLDPENRKQLYDLLLGSSRDNGSTLICISHDIHPGFDRTLDMSEINTAMESVTLW